MSGLAIGVDLGGTNARAALVDVAGGGRILVEEKSRVTDHAPAAVADLVAGLIARVKTSHGADAPLPIGVGFAGMLRGATGVVANGPNYGWRDVDLGTLLRARLGAEVHLHNDMNAVAFGESRYGGERPERDLLCVYVGTGVGGGMVLAGNLYIGTNHLAGEIGHVKVVVNGRLCGCGQRGCIEAYAGGTHLAARARQELGAGAVSLAVELAGGAANVHAGHLDQAAAAGDPFAVNLLDEVAPLLALVLANAVTLLNPSVLVLGGGVWERAPELRRRVLAVLPLAVNAPASEGLTIRDTRLGDNAGVLGAATLASMH